MNRYSELLREFAYVRDNLKITELPNVKADVPLIVISAFDSYEVFEGAPNLYIGECAEDRLPPLLDVLDRNKCQYYVKYT